MNNELLEWMDKERKRRMTVDFATRQLLRTQVESRGADLKKALEAIRGIGNTDLSFLSSLIAKKIEQVEQDFDVLFRNHCLESGLILGGKYPQYTVSDDRNAVYVRVLDPFVKVEIDGMPMNGRTAKPEGIVQAVIKVLRTKRKMKVKEEDVQRFASVLRSCYDIVTSLTRPNEGVVKIKDVLSLLKVAYAQQDIDAEVLRLLAKVYGEALLDVEMYPSRRSEDSVQMETKEGPRSYALMRLRR